MCVRERERERFLAFSAGLASTCASLAAPAAAKALVGRVRKYVYLSSQMCLLGC